MLTFNAFIAGLAPQRSFPCKTVPPTSNSIGVQVRLYSTPLFDDTVSLFLPAPQTIASLIVFLLPYGQGVQAILDGMSSVGLQLVQMQMQIFWKCSGPLRTGTRVIIIFIAGPPPTEQLSFRSMIFTSKIQHII